MRKGITVGSTSDEVWFRVVRVSTVMLVGGVGSPQNGFEVTASTERALIGLSRELRVVPSESGESQFSGKSSANSVFDIGMLSLLFPSRETN
jgi:hypothetical protein